MFILSKISEGILNSRRAHTQINPNTEILQSVENPESLFRNRNGKNKSSTSHTERYLIQEYFYSFKDLDLELNVGKCLLRSKSYSYLKQTEINPNRLESYLLDSLWLNLQNPLKVEESSPIFQTY